MLYDSMHVATAQQRMLHAQRACTPAAGGAYTCMPLLKQRLLASCEALGPLHPGIACGNDMACWGLLLLSSRGLSYTAPGPAWPLKSWGVQTMLLLPMPSF